MLYILICKIDTSTTLHYCILRDFSYINIVKCVQNLFLNCIIHDNNKLLLSCVIYTEIYNTSILIFSNADSVMET